MLTSKDRQNAKSGPVRSPCGLRKTRDFKSAIRRSKLRFVLKRGRLWKDGVARGCSPRVAGWGRFMVHVTVCAKHGSWPTARKNAKIYIAREWSKGRNDPVNGKIGDGLGGGLRSLSSPHFCEQQKGGEERLRRPAENNSRVPPVLRPGRAKASSRPAPHFPDDSGVVRAAAPHCLCRRGRKACAGVGRPWAPWAAAAGDRKIR